MSIAVKVAQRSPNRSLINKLCFYSNRSITSFNKWHFYPSSIQSIATVNSHSHHICSSKCQHLCHPNTINIRSMATTQDKNEEDNNDNEETEEQEEESESGESDTEMVDQQITDLEAKVDELQTELTKYKEALARSHADIMNIQNMGKKDVESAKKFAIRGFSKDMLNVADSLDGCIKVVDQHLNDYMDKGGHLDDNVKSVIEGVKLTQTTLLDTFGRHGITKIESLHTDFDPNYHEALYKQPTEDHPEDTVVTVISEGYTIKDAVLRAAKVGVSTKPPQTQQTQENEASNNDEEQK